MGRVFLLPTVPSDEQCKTQGCTYNVRVVVHPGEKKRHHPVIRLCGRCDCMTFAAPKEPIP